MLDIKRATLGDILTVHLTGQLNMQGCGDLGKVLDAWLTEGGAHTLLDFASVTYINSAGLKLLWRHSSLANAKAGRVVLSSVHDNVFQVFDISGLARLFLFANTFEEALALFQESSLTKPQGN